MSVIYATVIEKNIIKQMFSKIRSVGISDRTLAVQCARKDIVFLENQFNCCALLL